MSHEIFEIERKPELDEKEQEYVSHLRDQLSIAESLGLEAQAASIKASIATTRARLIRTQPMAETEFTIWRAWLPTVYIDFSDNRWLQLATYNFDRIPSPVLKVWQRHKESELFGRFEIWTPETHQLDPILVGVNGNTRHLLARWGESDANLVSFDDIKHELARRWYETESMGNTMGAVGLTMAALFSSFCLFMALNALGLATPDWSTKTTITTLVITTLVAIGTFVYVRRWIANRGLRSSALMQAIAKDDSVQRDLLPASA